MQSVRITLLAVLAVASLSSCGSGRTGEGTDAPEEVMNLLRAVPSDALAVSVKNSCSDAVSLLDSTNVFRSLDYGRVGNSPAVISWCFDGELSPVMAIDAGRSGAGMSAARALEDRADSLGLFTAYYAPDSLVGKHAMLVMTPSEALLTATNRHITEKRSILDANGFTSALAFAGNSRTFTILRNSGASRLLPAELLEGIFNRRKAANFLRTIADWITVTPEGSGSWRIDATRGDSPSYYTNLFNGLPLADSRLGDILPPDTEFALSLPVPQPEFRDAFEKYQDASVRYTPYIRQIDTLKARSGKSPLDWEKETGIREVGLIVFGGRKIVAARPARTEGNAQPSENPWRGFIPALYGSAFSLADDSACAAVSGWLIYGSADDLDSFISAQPQEATSKWPGKGTHIVMYKSGKFICWNKKGIYLWNSSQ